MNRHRRDRPDKHNHLQVAWDKAQQEQYQRSVADLTAYVKGLYPQREPLVIDPMLLLVAAAAKKGRGNDAR